MHAIQDSLTAWSFDNAVALFGEAVVAEIRESTREAKDAAQADRVSQLILTKWLREQDDEGMTRTFKDPAERFRRA